jgi:GMP synthase (glutamine-hydrolysing)
LRDDGIQRYTRTMSRSVRPTPDPATATGQEPARELRVGVLLCDHIDDAVQAEGHADYPERYRRLLDPPTAELTAEAGGGEARRPIRPVMFDLTTGDMPEDPQQCEGWLIGGSRRDAHADDGFVPTLVRFAAAARQAAVPQVGICFGHQILARALGGTVERADGWGAGVHTYEVVDAAPWMAREVTEVAIVASHRDQVTRLPEDAELLLRAAYCPIAGFRIGETVFGVQGHPEFDTALSRTLSLRRRTTLGEPTASAALDSLRRPPDNRLVNRWIRGFLTGTR